jgi:hypothetical protein
MGGHSRLPDPQIVQFADQRRLFIDLSVFARQLVKLWERRPVHSSERGDVPRKPSAAPVIAAHGGEDDARGRAPETIRRAARLAPAD